MLIMSEIRYFRLGIREAEYDDFPEIVYEIDEVFSFRCTVS